MTIRRIEKLKKTMPNDVKKTAEKWSFVLFATRQDDDA